MDKNQRSICATFITVNASLYCLGNKHEGSAGFVRLKRGKKIPSKFHLLFNKRWRCLHPFLPNEPGTECTLCRVYTFPIQLNEKKIKDIDCTVCCVALRVWFNFQVVVSPRTPASRTRCPLWVSGASCRPLSLRPGREF
jgi:hypothetical protein